MKKKLAQPQPHRLTAPNPYGKKFVFLIKNLNEIVPKLRSQWGLCQNLIEIQEPHQEPRQKSRTQSRTSSKIKILGKTSLRFSLRFPMRKKPSLRISMRISMRYCPRLWFLMRFLMRFSILNEVFDEILDSQWGSCPRPHWDLNFETISLRFSMRKTKIFRKESERPVINSHQRHPIQDIYSAI